MKNKPLLILLLMLCSCLPSKAQEMSVSTDPFLWAKRKPNVHLHLPYKQFAFSSGFQLYKGNDSKEVFDLTTQSVRFNAELRFYPFGGVKTIYNHENWDSKKYISRHKKHPCGIWNDKDRLRNRKKKFRGLYFAPGISIERAKLLVLPKGHEFQLKHHIASQYTTFTVGYFFQWNSFTVDLAYGLQAGKNKVEGSSEAINQLLKTPVNPWGHNWRNEFSIRIGYSIPWTNFF